MESKLSFRLEPFLYFLSPLSGPEMRVSPSGTLPVAGVQEIGGNLHQGLPLSPEKGAGAPCADAKNTGGYLILFPPGVVNARGC